MKQREKQVLAQSFTQVQGTLVLVTGEYISILLNASNLQQLPASWSLVEMSGVAARLAMTLSTRGVTTTMPFSPSPPPLLPLSQAAPSPTQTSPHLKLCNVLFQLTCNTDIAELQKRSYNASYCCWLRLFGACIRVCADENFSLE